MTIELLNTDEAAELLRMPRRTLEDWRHRGGGPVYRKHGRRVFYTRRDLEDWSAGGTRRSTSEQQSAA